MTESKHLALPLSPADPYSARYLVPHSGLQEGLERLSLAKQRVVDDPTQFCIATLQGPTGSGKTHLVRALFSDSDSWSGVDWTRGGIETAEFISCYDARRREGGILTVELRRPPHELTDDPHILSRLAAGELIELSYPSEEELQPLLQSLLERRNLTLKQAQLDYLIRRLPKSPLSFDSIFATLDDLSLAENKPVKRSLIRQAMEKSNG